MKDVVSSQRRLPKANYSRDGARLLKQDPPTRDPACLLSVPMCPNFERSRGHDRVFGAIGVGSVAAPERTTSLPRALAGPSRV